MLGSALLGSFYLASARAQTPGAPPPTPEGRRVARYARAGIARSNATRSNYIRPHITVLLTKFRYPHAEETVDVTLWTRLGTLNVSQAVGEQDTCSLTLTPLMPAEHVPQVGDTIAVGLAAEHSGEQRRIAGGLEFRGPIVQVQHDRRSANASPWVSIAAVDWQWWFDAQLVNWVWPRQSAYATINDLLARYVNFSQVISDPALMTTFTDAYVPPDLPECPAFTATNWRPSDVLRHLVLDLQGGWYLDPLRQLHVWANQANEPGQSDPRVLSNYLRTLKTFRHRYDATQVRRRVIVEGMITQSLTDVPLLTVTNYTGGIPVEDARPLAAGGRVRFGAQWANQTLGWAQPTDQNLPAAHVSADFALGGPAIYMSHADWVNGPGTNDGWIKVAEQLIRYEYATWESTGVALHLSPDIPFGKPVQPIKTGEVLTWMPWVGRLWQSDAHEPPVGTLMPLQPTLKGDDMVLIADAIDPDANEAWAQHLPPLEALVQDQRYVYSGATDRARADLNFFRMPLLAAEWETEDFNARPGRKQTIQLTGDYPVSAVLTIGRVSLSFPLRNVAPRRTCQATTVKRATLLQTVTTDQV